MYKANQRPPRPPSPFKTVLLTADAGLSRLLRAGMAGTHENRHFGAMAKVAKPDHACRTVQVPASLVPAIADGLAELLRHGREVSDPAAGALAAFAGREFGVTEPVPASRAPRRDNEEDDW